MEGEKAHDLQLTFMWQLRKMVKTVARPKFERASPRGRSLIFLFSEWMRADDPCRYQQESSSSSPCINLITVDRDLSPRSRRKGYVAKEDMSQNPPILGKFKKRRINAYVLIILLAKNCGEKNRNALQHCNIRTARSNVQLHNVVNTYDNLDNNRAVVNVPRFNFTHRI